MSPDYPDSPHGDCPNLTFEDLSADCSWDAATGSFVITVTVVIKNSGGAPVTGPFCVDCGTSPDVGNGNSVATCYPIAPGGTCAVTVTFLYTGSSFCPSGVNVTVTLDADQSFPECPNGGEADNVQTVFVCCPAKQPPREGGDR
jgi:hypothetical protein